MASISFSQPLYLFFLFLVPLFILIYLVTMKTSKSAALKFANFELIARIKGVDILSRNIFVFILSMLIVALLVFSLSGTTLHVVLDSSSTSFVLAIDTSKSMEADDVPPSRIEAAKRAAIDFVDSSPIGTNMGVISFSGNSFIEQDVTDNKGLIKSAIRDIVISEVGGTDIFEAVITGNNLLEGEGEKSIILLSDGQVNVGDITDAIEYANRNDLIVHTIAFGTETGGQTSFGISKVDEDSLQALAYNTDGGFSRATDRDELLQSFEDAVSLERRKVAIDISRYLLIATIVLFTLEFFLINTRYRRLP